MYGVGTAWHGLARAVVALGFAVIGLLALAEVSQAAPPQLLTKFPEVSTKGPGANQLNGPRALASDPDNGHVYVAEGFNNRISEFDPWGVFVKAWGWGVADGAGAPQVCAPLSPEVSPPAALCRRGIRGSGAGQMSAPNGVAVDPGGAVYVLEQSNLRVQKFSAAGEFLLMFGRGVNKTTGANRCTKADLEAGEVCGIGLTGSGNGEFSPPPLDPFGDYLDVAADGTVYVGDSDRIQVFAADGTFQSQLPLPEDGFAGSLALDPVSGDVYLAFPAEFGQPKAPIFRLDSTTGAVVDTLESDVASPTRVEGLFVDLSGNLYAILDPQSVGEPELEPRIVEFGPSGDVLIGFAEEFDAPAPRTVVPLGLTGNSVGDLYVGETNSIGAEFPGSFSAVSVFGPPPIALAPPPSVPPAIGDQFATAVGTTSATVRARINPRFFNDTKYHVEYGTADCAANPCQQQPTPPGSTLTAQIVNGPLLAAPVVIKGLAPGTIYHYRFVAESGGGGPVFGSDHTFTTAAPAPKQPACEGNQAFRPGAAAFLPDCRAYEMVSPVDKNGADISVVFNVVGDPAGLDQAASDGNALTYSAFRAFGNVESSPYASQYLARRTANGWANNGISPPRRGPTIFAGSAGLDSQYKGFSPDLCRGWLLQDADLSLAEGSVPGLPNFYRRDICAGGGYSALAPLVPPSVKQPSEFQPELQGTSADGSEAIFIAKGKLTNNAVAATQLYEVGPAGLRLVCILPNKSALKGECSAGTGAGTVRADRGASVSNAVSDDGNTIYWSEGLEKGRLFVRVNRTDTFTVSNEEAQFWTAATDGSKALYSVGAQLFLFDLASNTSTPIANGFRGLLGASDDASKIYFVSTQNLDAGATAGEPNLYLATVDDPLSFEFVATLSEADVSASNAAPSPVATFPIRHASRVTPDGGAVAFSSSGSPTGYDNTDVASGQKDAGVFLYRADSDRLVCVSCNPTGARPAGRNVQKQKQLKVPFWAAALLPPAANQVTFSHLLSDNGSRLFFESFDALALRDTNSQLDVYEWEAVGSGNCSQTAPGFHDSFGGCVNLISSGDNPQGSELVDASADGRDVFFKTASSLLPQDPGLIDVYDARENGGFPLPEPPPAPCLGEACQNPRPAPNDPTPSSQTFVGPGDETLSCPKGRHRVVKGGQERCVKDKKRKKKRGGSKSKTRRAHR